MVKLANGAPPVSTEAKRKELEEQLHARLTAAVRAGMVTVDDAMVELRAGLDDLKKRTDAIEAGNAKFMLPGSDEAKRPDGKEFSFMDVYTSLLAGRTKGTFDGRAFDASMEWEMSRQMAQAPGHKNTEYEARAANETDTGAGGAFLVPGAVLTERFIPLLRPQLVSSQLGAQQENFSTFPIEIPRELTTVTAGGAQENEALAETEPTFGMMSLRPHVVGVFSKVSRRFFTYGQGAENILRNMMAREIAIQMNRYYLKGTGIDDQPLGIYNQAGNSAAVTNAQVYAQYLALLKVEEALVTDDVVMTNAKWATCVKLIRWLRGLRSEATSADHGEFNRHIIGEANQKTILGYPYVQTSLLASGTEAETIFGDFGQSIIATFGTMMLEASNVANDALQKRQTHIVAYLDMDVGVFQPNAFCVITGQDLSAF